MMNSVVYFSWFLNCLIVGHCFDNGVEYSHDRYKDLIFYESTIMNADTYNTSQANSRCACRYKCSVNDNCTIVSVIPSPQGVECRISYTKMILETGLQNDSNGVTFYKRRMLGIEDGFYPSLDGVFYWPVTEPKSTKLEAREVCKQRGGRLAIMKTFAAVRAAHLATKFVEKTLRTSTLMNGEEQELQATPSSLMFDLERESLDGPYFWGDGSRFRKTDVPPESVMYTNGNLGVGIMYTSPSLIEFEGMDHNKSNPFLCQFDPLRRNW